MRNGQNHYVKQNLEIKFKHKKKFAWIYQNWTAKTSMNCQISPSQFSNLVTQTETLETVTACCYEKISNLRQNRKIRVITSRVSEQIWIRYLGRVELLISHQKKEWKRPKGDWDLWRKPKSLRTKPNWTPKCEASENGQQKVGMGLFLYFLVPNFFFYPNLIP